METTNLMNKGWINPISTTVFLILLVISIALYSLNIFGELILFLCILTRIVYSYRRPMGSGSCSSHG